MSATDAGGIGCPQCGGPLDFSEGSRTTVCGSCRTPLAVTGAAGITRYYLDDNLDLAEARTAARRFLATKGVDEAMVSQLRFVGGELCFLPFWRLRGHAVGWQWAERETIIVEEYVDEQGVSRQREQKGPQEREHEILALPVDYSSPACDLTPYGLAGIATVSSVLQLKGMAYDRVALRGTIFDPAKEAEQVRREAMGLVRERSRKKGTLRHEERLELCGEQLALVYYPVWKLGFARGERLYPVVVDGVNGRVLKARFPGQAEIRVLAPLVTVTLLVFAFCFHLATGIVATALFLGWFASREEFSPAGLVRFFFLLVEPGEEVEHG